MCGSVRMESVMGNLSLIREVTLGKAKLNICFSLYLITPHIITPAYQCMCLYPGHKHMCFYPVDIY